MPSSFSNLRGLLITASLVAGGFFLLQLVVQNNSPRDHVRIWMAAVDGIALPGVPDFLTPSLSAEEIQVQIMESPEQVAAVAKAAGSNVVVAQRPGVALLVDGQLFASNIAAVVPLLYSLGWEKLPVVVNEPQAGVSYTLPKASAKGVEVSAGLHFYRALRGLGEVAPAHFPLLALMAMGAALGWLFRPACHKFLTLVSRHGAEGGDEGLQDQQSSGVRVVLVKDHFALKNARVAIGEEYILAFNNDAFAFASGWILAVRDHTVFDLLDKLGWSDRPVEIFSESDLRRSPVPGVDRSWCAEKQVKRGQALALVDALSLCGSIAHAEGIPIA